MAQIARAPYSGHVMSGGRQNRSGSLDRAFIVQFCAPSEPGAAWLSGRVEHVMSGQSAKFATSRELMKFFERVIAKIPQSSRFQENSKCK